MTRPKLSLSACFAGALLLAGCSVFDPYRQAGTWRPNHAGLVLRAAEVADPMDLVQGRSAAGADGMQATIAVERLRHDQVKSLPDSTIVQIGGSGSTSGGSGGGSGGNSSSVEQGP